MWDGQDVAKLSGRFISIYITLRSPKFREEGAVGTSEQWSAGEARLLAAG